MLTVLSSNREEHVMQPIRVSTQINGERVVQDVEPRVLLVHFLRDHVGLTGTHIGCDTSQCGACTVAMDGMTVKSCTVLAVQAEGHGITPIQGGATPRRMTPLQPAFTELHGLHFGLCPPGLGVA